MDDWKCMEMALDLAMKGGADQADVVQNTSLSEEVEVFEGQIAKAESSTSSGVGIRLLKGGKAGYAYTRRMSEQSISVMVQDALDQSELGSELKLDLPTQVEVPDLDLEDWNEGLMDVTMGDLKDISLEMEARPRQEDARIENVPHAGMGKGASWSRLMNHKGMRLEERSNDLSGYLYVVAAEGEQKKTGGFGDGSRSLSDISVDRMVERSIQYSTELLGARPVAGGEHPVVISNRISASLLAMYFSSVSAEMVLKGQSRFEGKVGEKVAVDGLQVSCEPLIPGMPGSRLFDDEGLLCQRTPIIESGVLKSFTHNLETAALMGQQPTGHGSRGLGGRTGIGFSNLLVSKGEQSLDELLGAHSSCLYVTKLEGGAACSPVSGEISIGIQGFWVENGKIVHPVDAMTLSGNFFDMIHNIEGFSNTWYDSFSSNKAPDLLVRGMALSG